MAFEKARSLTNRVLIFLPHIPVDSSLLCIFLPPWAKGYSVLLFEVDICIIRLRCSIVSRSPIRGCSRGERVLSSPTMAASPPLSPSTQPAPASHPAVRPQRPFTFAAVGGGRDCEEENERQSEKGGGGREREIEKQKWRGRSSP